MQRTLNRMLEAEGIGRTMHEAAPDRKRRSARHADPGGVSSDQRI